MQRGTIVQWRKAAEGEVENIRAKLAPLEALLKRKLAEIEAYDHLLALGDGQAPPASAPGREVKRRTNSVADVAYEVLKQHGKPLYYKDFVALIEESGFTIPGQDAPANLIAHICRDDRFSRVASGTYALAEWPGSKARPSRRRGRRPRKPAS